MEKIFGMINCQVEVKVNYATYLLLGDVEYWWKSTWLMIESTHEEVSWTSFKRKFLNKNFPMSTKTRLGGNFLKQLSFIREI